MEWCDVPQAIGDWAEKYADIGSAVRPAVGRLYTPTPVGVYVDAASGRGFLYGPHAGSADTACVAASVKAAGLVCDDRMLSLADLRERPLIKLGEAASPWLQKPLEWANFFPGQYPWGQNNHASPLAAMLTSSLLGAGLGWAGGKVLQHTLMPEGYGENLGRTGLMLGGLAGASLGSVPGMTNWLNGGSFGDEDPFGQHGAVRPEFRSGTGSLVNMLEKRSRIQQIGVLARTGKQAFDRFRRDEPAGWMPPAGGSASDVHVDTLGRVLWNSAIPADGRAAILGTMYAAQQLPSQRADDDWVTGDQLGALALRAGGDYLSGVLVGSAINAAIGTPFTSPAIGTAYAAARVVQQVVPKMFGG